MGKKHRRHRKHSRGDDDDDFDDNDAREPGGDHPGHGAPTGAAPTPGNAAASSKSFKDLSFAEKREFRQKQAAEKRRAKQKCFLCGRWGHVRRECPGIADDGRGMSRYKGKSDPKGEKLKREQEKARREREQQQQHAAATKPEDHHAVCLLEKVGFPEGFFRPPHGEQEEEPLPHDEEEHDPPIAFFDPHCRVLEAVEYLRAQHQSHTNKKSSSSAAAAMRSAEREYKALWDRAVATTHLSGAIVPTTVQSNREWTNPVPWLVAPPSPADDDATPAVEGGGAPRAPVCFALGLAPSVPCTTEAEQAEARRLLRDTIDAHNDHHHPNDGNTTYQDQQQQQQQQQQQHPIQALWAVLDHTKPPRTHEAQQHKLRCLLKVAHETDRTLQCKVLPGIPHDLAGPEAPPVQGTDYARALLSLQEALAVHLEQQHHRAEKAPLLRVHLIGWQGRSDHTLGLLRAFRADGPLPCEVFVGMDPTTTFSKATHLHELAFEVPPGRLVLETGSLIPSAVTKRLGRTAAPHAAWWPFVAEAVAQHSKKHDPITVARVALENLARLYPHLRLPPQPRPATTTPGPES